jgi:HSP20 family protein
VSPDGSTMQVDVEIAGAEPTDLRVMVEARRLYIVGRRIDRERDGRGSVLQKEIAYGDFARKLHLPLAVNFDDATASYRDGILTIRLPISEHSAVPTRRTEIRMTVKRILA